MEREVFFTPEDNPREFLFRAYCQDAGKGCPFSCLANLQDKKDLAKNFHPVIS